MLARQANAKVNLTLRVTGKRDDGYHLLDSLVVFVSVGDTVRVAESETGQTTLAITGDFGAGLPTDGGNLILKAAAALAACTDRPVSAHITLEKTLPVAAGIGGGSADAAVALSLLNDYWELGLDPAALAEIALSLGADVPACLVNTPVRMMGIGEILTPLAQCPKLGVLLVNDGTACPTGPVFAARSAPFSAPSEMPDAFTDADALIDFVRSGRNDLEPPALSLHPSIARVAQTVAAQADCHLARMSGSGATVFGLFPNLSTAEAAAQRLQSETGWWCAAGEILPGAA